MGIPVGRTQSFRNVARSLGLMLIRPPAIAYFVLALMMSLWIGPVVYTLLRIRFVDPTGLSLWLLALAGGACFVLGFGAFFVQAPGLVRLSNLAQRCKRAGDLAGYAANREAYRQRAMSLNKRPLWIAMLSIYVIIPASVALVMSDGTPYVISENGVRRLANQHERLAMTIRNIEHRGILKTFR